MAFEQKDNSGAVFKNDRKEKDTHPDRTGTAMIGGKEYYISGWLKQDRNGHPFLSLAFKPKDGAARQATPQAPARVPLRQEMDDEIPF